MMSTLIIPRLNVDVDLILYYIRLFIWSLKYQWRFFIFWSGNDTVLDRKTDQKTESVLNILTRLSLNEFQVTGN